MYINRAHDLWPVENKAEREKWKKLSSASEMSGAIAVISRRNCTFGYSIAWFYKLSLDSVSAVSGQFYSIYMRGFSTTCRMVSTVISP